MDDHGASKVGTWENTKIIGLHKDVEEVTIMLSFELIGKLKYWWDSLGPTHYGEINCQVPTYLLT